MTMGRFLSTSDVVCKDVPQGGGKNSNVPFCLDDPIDRFDNEDFFDTLDEDLPPNFDDALVFDNGFSASSSSSGAQAPTDSSCWRIGGGLTSSRELLALAKERWHASDGSDIYAGVSSTSAPHSSTSSSQRTANAHEASEMGTQGTGIDESIQNVISRAGGNVKLARTFDSRALQLRSLSTGALRQRMKSAGLQSSGPRLSLLLRGIEAENRGLINLDVDVAANSERKVTPIALYDGPGYGAANFIARYWNSKHGV